jgi:hypothetical protein
VQRQLEDRSKGEAKARNEAMEGTVKAFAIVRHIIIEPAVSETYGKKFIDLILELGLKLIGKV